MKSFTIHIPGKYSQQCINKKYCLGIIEREIGLNLDLKRETSEGTKPKIEAFVFNLKHFFLHLECNQGTSGGLEVLAVGHCCTLENSEFNELCSVKNLKETSLSKYDEAVEVNHPFILLC